MNELASAIQKILPITVKNFNNVRLPALETAWGRSFKNEFLNENQKTQEIAKSYARPFNNGLYENIGRAIDGFSEDTSDGHDMVFRTVRIEHKNSFSVDSNSFTGNSGSNKTPWHLLTKFSVDDNGKITQCFACLIDTSKMKTGWNGGASNSNYSTLKISNEDIEHVILISGSLQPSKKYAKLILEDI